MSRLDDAAMISSVLTADRSRSRPFCANTLGLEVLAEDEFAVAWFTDPDGAVLRLTQFG